VGKSDATKDMQSIAMVVHRKITFTGGAYQMQSTRTNAPDFASLVSFWSTLLESYVCISNYGTAYRFPLS
jgi:hypothetical protein